MDGGTAIALEVLAAIVFGVGSLMRSGRIPAAAGSAGVVVGLWITWVGPIWAQPAAAPLTVLGLLALGWIAARSLLRVARPNQP